MQERSTNRFAYATLIKTGFDPNDPEVLLEVGMERPVDWDAVGDDGAIICHGLSFVLTFDHVQIKQEGSDKTEPLGIPFRYARVVRDHGLHGDAHVYVLGLRTAPIARVDHDGTIVLLDPDRDAMETAVSESERVRRKSWSADVGSVLIYWSHRGPADAAQVPNGAYEPDPPATEVPRATDDEVLKLCDAFDAFCRDSDPANDSSIPILDAEPDADLEWGMQATA